jgi:hypothetical protein
MRARTRILVTQIDSRHFRRLLSVRELKAVRMIAAMTRMRMSQTKAR